MKNLNCCINCYNRSDGDEGFCDNSSCPCHLQPKEEECYICKTHQVCLIHTPQKCERPTPRCEVCGDDARLNCSVCGQKATLTPQQSNNGVEERFTKEFGHLKCNGCKDSFEGDTRHRNNPSQFCDVKMLAHITQEKELSYQEGLSDGRPNHEALKKDMELNRQSLLKEIKGDIDKLESANDNAILVLWKHDVLSLLAKYEKQNE